MCSPLALMGCGEGWEAQKVENAAPYSASRTAGSGVAYVRAKMMPEKELNLEAVAEEPEEVAEEIIAEEYVEEAYAEEVVDQEPVLDAEEIFTDAQIKGGAPSTDADAQNVMEEVIMEEASNEVEAVEKTPEEIIEEISAGLVDEDSDNSFEISVEAPVAANIQPEAGDYDEEIFSEDMISYDNEIQQGDFNFMSDGQEDIDDIYGDPLEGE